MSNLNEKKAKTLFSRFDVDGNGSLEEDDIKKWSEKLIEIRNVEPERQDEIRDQMKHIWIAFFQPADKDNDGKIEYSELLDYLLPNEAIEKEQISKAISVIYDVIDVNHDGGISAEEFSVYFKSLGLEEDDFVSKLFDEIDNDGDGSLGEEEFTNFGLGFFFDQDEECASRHFFGPLVD